MGDRMTAHLPIVPREAVEIADPYAPPSAPMHMPQQVLTAESGMLRHALVWLLSALPIGHRRPG
jgi:hypothetical protein